MSRPGASSIPPAGELLESESGRQREPDRARRAWSDVVVVVRERIVPLVEQVLEIHLRAQVRSESEKECAIQTRERGKRDRIVDGRVHLRLVNDTKPNAEP